MKFIILVALVALAFGDHHDRSFSPILHQERSKHALEYGLPLNSGVIINGFTKDAKSEYKENKAVTFTSSSSHSHTVKNKSTQISSHHGTKPVSLVYQNVPHKNDVSIFSFHSTASHFSNRTNDGENKSKEKTFGSGSTLTQSSDVPIYDDGSYKSELYKTHDQNSQEQASDISLIHDGSYKHVELSNDQHTNKLTDSNDASNFDNGSYNPELYKNADQSPQSTYSSENDAYASNDGSYKNDVLQNQQIIKSILKHNSQLGTASNYDDGSYKPELYKTLDHTKHSLYGLPSRTSVFIDGSFKQEALSHPIDTSNSDDGSYKPELYKNADQSSQSTYSSENDAYTSNDGSYKNDVLQDQQIIKSTQKHNSQFGTASNYDDGSYKPELYKTLDHTKHSLYGLPSRTSVFIDGSFKQEALSHSIDTSNSDDGSYKPELYKDLDHTSSIKSTQQGGEYISRAHVSGAMNFDDGLYKPELYKTIDTSAFNDGSYKNEPLQNQQIIKSMEQHEPQSSDGSNYEDGSYKPELYKTLDQKQHNTYGLPALFNDGSFKNEVSRDQQIVKFNEQERYKQTSQADSSLITNVDDGSYKPELYKTLDHTKHSLYGLPSRTSVFIDGSFKQEALSHSIDTSNSDDGSYKPELYKELDDTSSIKSTQQGGEYISRAHVSGAMNYDDGSYKPELYKTLDQKQHNTYGLPSLFNDGSFKNEVSRDQQIVKFNEQEQYKQTSHADSSLVTNVDDGSYKPELYKTIDTHGFNDGSYKHEASRDQNIIQSVKQPGAQSIDTSNFDDGSYKPELYKNLEYTRHNLYGLPSDTSAVFIVESLNRETLRDQQLIKSTQQLQQLKHNSKALTSDTSNYDDGSYKPELYKNIDHTPQNSYSQKSDTLSLNSGSYKHVTSHNQQINTRKNSELNFDNRLYQDVYSSSSLQKNNLNFKPHERYDVPLARNFNIEDTRDDDTSGVQGLHTSII